MSSSHLVFHPPHISCSFRFEYGTLICENVKASKYWNTNLMEMRVELNFSQSVQVSQGTCGNWV